MVCPMTLDLLLSFVGFALTASLTPGPAGFVLLASSATFGIRRSLPLLFGISLGYVLMILFAGLAFEPFMAAPPALFMVSKAVFALWVLWLAWKISRRLQPAQETQAAQRLLSFPQALAFQLVNPASWAVAFGTMVAFTSATPSDSGFVSLVLLLTAIFAAVNLPGIGLYALLGEVLHRLLHDPAKLRIFKIVMAVLLVVSIAPLLLGAVF